MQDPDRRRQHNERAAEYQRERKRRRTGDWKREEDCQPYTAQGLSIISERILRRPSFRIESPGRPTITEYLAIDLEPRNQDL